MWHCLVTSCLTCDLLLGTRPYAPYVPCDMSSYLVCLPRHNATSHHHNTPHNQETYLTHPPTIHSLHCHYHMTTHMHIQMGKRLIVVANLKPRSLVGFKSCGMVLCAASVEGMDEKVEFLEPPAGAALGARVTAEGLLPLLEPLSQKQCDKQKAFGEVAPDLRTDGTGVGMWRDFRLVVDGEPCTAPTVTDGSIR